MEIHNTVGAKSLFDVLSAKTMLSLLAVALLALVGHYLHRRYLHTEMNQDSAARNAR